ncbi:hypothetical protein AGOR_G00245390 [Albula goreensis]|uniref:Podocalyxin n=1 Tax=Albula goreensis TaxID=1534307 RepID=A0A8T3CDQ1_9TELE|nr:hypothetical protein AGOR_G00245390 [Albula goreensis]
MRAIFAVLLLGIFSHHAYGNNEDTNTTTAPTPPSPTSLSSNSTESTSVLSPHTTSETVTNVFTTQSSTQGVSTPSPSTNTVITVPSTRTQAPTQTSKAPSTISLATLNPVLSTTEAMGTTQTTGSSGMTETTLKATFVTPTISATVQPTGSTQQPTPSSDPNKSTATVPPTNGTDPNPQTSLPTDTATTTSQLTLQSTGMPPVTQSKSTDAALTVTQTFRGSSKHTATSMGSTTTIQPSQKVYSYKNFSKGNNDANESVDAKICKELLKTMFGDMCTMTFENGKMVSVSVKVNQTYLDQLRKKHEPKPMDQETHQKNTTLIAILCSCGAVLAVTFGVITYIYITRHRQSYKKNQVSCHSYRLFDTWHRKSHSKQHLTEEMQTVENGYHDNPTLEVMEVQPEMQEKKAAMNGEFNDSWIVPFDNLAKDDIPDEEDTHL